MKGAYLSTLIGGGRALEASEPLFPEVGMMVSPSDLSLSTKLSTSFPLAPSLSALLGPLGLEKKSQRSSLNNGFQLLKIHFNNNHKDTTKQ